MTTIAISADALLSLPHAALIDLYNAESKRLAGNLEVHTVDEACKPLYIVKLLARLPVRYQMMAETKSNEQAALSQPVQEKAATAGSAMDRMERAPLTKSAGFSLLR
jgi:hypothetical protein